MACLAVHSHLLYGLLITQINIIIVLLLSEAYGNPTSTVINKKSVTVYNFDVNKFKVLTALGAHGLCALCLFVCLIANNVPKIAQHLPPVVITTILAFDLLFNVIGGVCLWLHTSTPRGHSTSIRGAAVLSSIAFVYTISTVIFYCIQKPTHPSLREILADKQQPKSSALIEAEEKTGIKTKSKKLSKKNKKKSKRLELDDTQRTRNTSDGSDKPAKRSTQKKSERSKSKTRENDEKKTTVDGNEGEKKSDEENQEQEEQESKERGSKQKSAKKSSKKIKTENKTNKEDK